MPAPPLPLASRWEEEHQGQLLSPETRRLRPSSRAGLQMETLHRPYATSICGACGGSTPGHKGQFSTAAVRLNEKSQERNGWNRLDRKKGMTRSNQETGTKIT